MCVSESSTARHLQRSGVTAVSQQAWSKITVYTKQGFRYDSWHLGSSQQGFLVNTAHLGLLLFFFCLCSWLEKNTPFYYSECARVAGPLVEHVYEKAKAAAVVACESAVQLVLWVREKTPQAADWVEPRRLS